MGTRTIVTFHPDVECDVCGRRLLRGEQSDVFIAGGQRRVVCELCTSRATHEGWLRESDGHSGGARAARPQRGLSLLGRLRQSRFPGPQPSAQDARAARRARGGGSPGGLYDFLDSSSPELGGVPGPEDAEDGLAYGDPGRGASAETYTEHGAGEAVVHSSAQPVAAGSQLATELAPTPGEHKVARALEVFNGGEQPRRMAGVARSLGVPSVSATLLGDSPSTVSIVVAWELCWYRYEVDLGDEAAGVRLAGQGMELDELSAAERLANAAADERGMLSLLDR